MPVVQRVISSKVCQLYAPSSPSRTRPCFPDSHMYSRALARLPCTSGSDSETALLVLGNSGDCSGGLGLFRPSRGVWVPVRFLELLVAFRGSFRIFPNPPRSSQEISILEGGSHLKSQGLPSLGEVHCGNLLSYLDCQGGREWFGNHLPGKNPPSPWKLAWNRTLQYD